MFEIYTFFGEAKEIEYGNKVKTQNDFDTMRRLRTMRLRRPSNHIFSNVQYDYDRNQNIVRQRNTVSQHNNLHLGGVSDKQYQYDKYNRLSRAIGTFTGFKEEQNYDLTMSYNATHGIVNKNQTHNVTLNQVPQNSVHNYQAEYFYDDDTHPHAPSLLQYQDGKSIKLSYDANGNLEHIQSDKDLVVVGNRDFEWDEQNRLLSVVDNGGQQISHYVYDHTGERTFKSEQGLSLANVSGQQAYEVSDMTNYTLYPSGFVTVNPERNEYTKHYYNNGKRLASRLMTLQGQFVSQNQLQPQAMSMQAMSATQSPQNCQQQLDAIMQYLANDPAMTDCLTAVQNINADPSYQNACDKLYAVNALNCSPADVIDVVITDPVYTPEEISELDCINAIYQLFYLSVYKSSSTYWLNADVKRCYSQIKGIIMKYFITPEPQRMDPCEFWEYLQQFLPCEPTPTIQEPVPTPTDPITYEPPVLTQPTPVHGFEPVQPSLNRVYYYHGDHLNSSTYVTDDIGRPVAYYDYLPFGEVAVEHNQTTNFNNGYKFNAKELDEATGMSYYGARYYDSRLSVFVSVDPLAEEFRNFSPYIYTLNNPIRFVDPDGRSPKRPNLSGITNVRNVLSGKQWIRYGSNVTVISTRSFLGYEVSRSTETRSSNNGTYQCADYSRLQVKQGNGDHTAVGAKKRIDMYVKTGGDKSKLDLQKGINLIVDNLKEGKAVMAGVMYDANKETGNANSATNHYVTIVGMGKDDNGYYFSYYDNYTGGAGKEVGTDLELNKFRLQKSSSGFYYFSDGEDGNIPYNGNKPATPGSPSKYILTEVRDNE
ncbi:RHS repeat-associated core domain-containing protein [Capnocytophaga sp. ARDL2]|uniref:RHS repeat domain-containing protein n=1 Tax=Capnocytophaga sp. ARDL2 TaxID=3238809 RepID=UPI003556B120